MTSWFASSCDKSFTRRHLHALLVVGLVLAGGTGCNSIFNGLLDPSQVGRFRGPVITNEIRRSISVADEPRIEIEAEEPTAEDLEVRKRDYALEAGDIIELSIFDLLSPGQPWVEGRQITQEGYITLPQFKRDLKVEGLTARELETYLEKTLQDEQLILVDPEVTILVREARSRTYNMLGSVGISGTDTIPKPEFRLIDALARARGITPVGGPRQPLVRTIYVFRRIRPPIQWKDEFGDNISSNDNASGPEFPGQPWPGQLGRLGRQSSAGMDLMDEFDNNYILASEVRANQSVQSQPGEQSGHWIWIDADQQWKYVKLDQAASAPSRAVARPGLATLPAVGKPVVAEEGAQEPLVDWESLLEEEELTQRIIRIPLAKLWGGDHRYNIVIRDGDTIRVPAPIQGEYYIMGNIVRPGPYSLTGREVTVRQAVASAGGLSALADPSRCELVRRIERDKEQLVILDVDRIFAGKDPDIMLKPDDVINIGTNPILPFLAVVRNAFRATYGFGFVYDRNFADIDSYGGQPNPTQRRRTEQQRLGLFF